MYHHHRVSWYTNTWYTNMVYTLAGTSECVSVPSGHRTLYGDAGITEKRVPRGGASRLKMEDEDSESSSDCEQDGSVL